LPVDELPLAFKLTLASIPAAVPYLATDAAKQQSWQQRLGTKARPRIGLVLAGALAKPLYLLLPFLPDYRWHLDSSDTPWYPAATLLRQAAYGDWQSVIAQLIAKLKSIGPDSNGAIFSNGWLPASAG